MMTQKRYYGNVPQPTDPRDVYSIFGADVTATLPTEFNLLSFMGANLDQGSLGSCGPNTADECIMSNQIQEGLEVWSASRLYIYWNTRYFMGTTNEDSGVDNRSMMKALATYGYCKEKTWPYVESKFRQKPPAEAYQEGSGNKITGYGAVVQSLPQMKAAIYSGDPFIFGFDVFPQMESDEAAATGVLQTPKVGQNPIGGHDVSLFGWSDKDGVFYFRNHWKNADGSWWGRRDMPGCGTIPYAYAGSARWARDFWIINSVPGTPPPPAPPPEPPAPPPAPPAPPAPATGQIVVTRPVTLTPGTYNIVPN